MLVGGTGTPFQLPQCYLCTARRIPQHSRGLTHFSDTRSLHHKLCSPAYFQSREIKNKQCRAFVFTEAASTIPSKSFCDFSVFAVLEPGRITMRFRAHFVTEPKAAVGAGGFDTSALQHSMGRRGLLLAELKYVPWSGPANPDSSPI